MRSSVCELKHSSIVRKFWLRIAYDCLLLMIAYVLLTCLFSKILSIVWIQHESLYVCSNFQCCVWFVETLETHQIPKRGGIKKWPYVAAEMKQTPHFNFHSWVGLCEPSPPLTCHCEADCSLSETPWHGSLKKTDQNMEVFQLDLVYCDLLSLTICKCTDTLKLLINSK